jgi:hypothetical protein
VVHGQSLSERFTQLFTFGDCGQPLCLSVDVVGGHGLHYIPSVTQGENDLLAFLTGSLATSLGSLPFTAATGVTTYLITADAPVPTVTSMGSIFAERSQTLGRGRLLAGANVNALSMHTIRGVPLRDLVLRFGHQNVGNGELGDPGFENDIIEVHTDLDVNLLVTSLFASYGIHNNIDIGVLVPIVRASLSGTSEAEVLAAVDPTPHLFGTPGNTALFALSSTEGSAIGLGDVAVRVKANLYQTNSLGAGVAAEVRLPTGDSANFLGSGQTAVRAFGILSGTTGNFSPHINAGFALRSGATQNNSLVGALGFDQLIAEHATLAVDILADYTLGDSQLQLPEALIFDAQNRRRVRLTDIPTDVRDDLLDASVGVKMRLFGEYTAMVNLLVPLSDGGLRPRSIWTAGFERKF